MASSLAPARIGNLREKTQQAPRGSGFQDQTSVIVPKKTVRYTLAIVRSRPSMEKEKALNRRPGHWRRLSATSIIDVILLPNPWQVSVIEMSHSHGTSRRDFIRRSVATSAAFALPSIVPAAVLGQAGAVAPSETISLGVIGIGPRCTYDLRAMLGFADVRCVAIADVQASRRDEGKRLVD